MVGALTVTVTDCAILPPSPEQVSVNFVVWLMAAVVAVPLSFCDPLQPSDAVQAVLF
jgi:hypothetical protein